MDDRYYSIEAAARLCGVDTEVVSRLVRTQRITAFITLPGLLAYPPRELRRPGEPLMFVPVMGEFALDPVAGAKLAAGLPVEVDIVWNYGEYVDGEYRNHGPVLLKDAYSPSPADISVNIDEVQQWLRKAKTEPKAAEPGDCGLSKEALLRLIGGLCILLAGKKCNRYVKAGGGLNGSALQTDIQDALTMAGANAAGTGKSQFADLLKNQIVQEVLNALNP